MPLVLARRAVHMQTTMRIWMALAMEPRSAVVPLHPRAYVGSRFCLLPPTRSHVVGFLVSQSVHLCHISILFMYLRRFGLFGVLCFSAANACGSVPITTAGYETECDSLLTGSSCAQTCSSGFYATSGDGMYTCPDGALTGSLVCAGKLYYIKIM
jgi:hypothetical protein